MALIVITVQDTENGAVVSLAAEPAMDMSAAPVGEAQQLAQLMLGALPVNAPGEPAKTDVELLNAMEGVLDKAAALTKEIGSATEGLAEPGPDPDALPHSTETPGT